jgi:hypothetical protein
MTSFNKNKAYLKRRRMQRDTYHSNPLDVKLNQIYKAIDLKEISRAEFKKEIETLPGIARRMQIPGKDNATILEDLKYDISWTVGWCGFSIQQDATGGGFTLVDSDEYTSALNGSHPRVLPYGATVDQFSYMFPELLA